MYSHCIFCQSTLGTNDHIAVGIGGTPRSRFKVVSSGESEAYAVPNRSARVLCRGTTSA